MKKWRNEEHLDSLSHSFQSLIVDYWAITYIIHPSLPRHPKFRVKASKEKMKLKET